MYIAWLDPFFDKLVPIIWCCSYSSVSQFPHLLTETIIILYLTRLIWKNKCLTYNNYCYHYHGHKDIFRAQFNSVQSLSRVWLFVTPWTAARQASLSIINSQSSLKLMSIESVMPSSHLILCYPLFLLPLIPPSIRVFSNESTLHMRWPKYWSFNFSIIHSKEHPGLIFFRMDWLDLLAVQGTLKSLLQHHSSKASILRRSAFLTVQLSHPCMTTGKTIALTKQNFVGKVMSLLLNMLYRLVITFLPRSKHLLISWLQSPSAVISEPKKIKSDILSTVSPSISHEVMGPDAMIFIFWMLSSKPTFSLSFIYIYIYIALQAYYLSGMIQYIVMLQCNITF